MATKRKVRVDKGRVVHSYRVKSIMHFIIEQDVVFVDQLQLLFVRYPNSTADSRKPTGPTLDVTRVLNLVRKWKDANLIEYEKPYQGQPGFVYATRKGLQDFGYGHLQYRPRDLSQLDHLRQVNWVRLYVAYWMKQQGYVGNWRWYSERVLRHMAEQEKDPAKKHPPKYPDAEVIYNNNQSHVAIEVERTRKSFQEYEEIKALYEGKTVGSKVWDRATAFHNIWYFHDPSLTTVLQGIFQDPFRLQSFDKLYLEDGFHLIR